VQVLLFLAHLFSFCPRIIPFIVQEWIAIQKTSYDRCCSKEWRSQHQFYLQNWCYGMDKYLQP
jgi:hypothetical protein